MNIFISYSWDDEDHKKWIKKLADDLISLGHNVLVDQYDLIAGDSITQFMEESITKSDKIIVVLTPTYKIKSVERKGGVGYEQQIISAEIMQGVGRRKFIPILRKGTENSGENCAVPTHFKGILLIDFINDNKFDESINILHRAIHDRNGIVKPTIGDRKPIQVKEPKFVFQLDENFKLKQSDLLITDMLINISDLIKEGDNFKIDFEIEELSEKYKQYLELKSRNNLEEDEIKVKLELYDYLTFNCFFYKERTIYDFLQLAIKSIITYCYFKNFYVHSFYELTDSIKYCLPLYKYVNSLKVKGQTGFDVFEKDYNWNFRINLSPEEVEELIHSTKIPKEMMLSFAGLDIFDLEHKTLIEKVVPKMVYAYTYKYFEDLIIDDETTDIYFKSNWRIGLS